VVPQGGEGSEGSVGVNFRLSAVPEAKPRVAAEIKAKFGTPKVSLAQQAQQVAKVSLARRLAVAAGAKCVARRAGGYGQRKM
jgi:hypothetical protein